MEPRVVFCRPKHPSSLVDLDLLEMIGTKYGPKNIYQIDLLFECGFHPNFSKDQKSKWLNLVFFLENSTFPTFWTFQLGVQKFSVTVCQKSPNFFLGFLLRQAPPTGNLRSKSTKLDPQVYLEPKKKLRIARLQSVEIELIKVVPRLGSQRGSVDPGRPGTTLRLVETGNGQQNFFQQLRRKISPLIDKKWFQPNK